MFDSFRVHRTALALLAAGGLAAAAATADADIVIDNFTSGSASLLTLAAGDSQVFEGGLTEALGGSRIVKVRNFGGVDDTAVSGGTVQSGAFDGVRGGFGTGDVQLVYQGVEFPGSIGGVNFTDLADVEFFRFDISANTTPSLTVALQFDSYDPFFANFSQQTSVTVAVPAGGGLIDVPVDTLDLSIVDVVNITFGYDFFATENFNDIVNQSFTVNSIVGVVPEPSSMVLAAAGVVPFLTRRRRM